MGEASGVLCTPMPFSFELPLIATLQVSSKVAPEEEVDMLNEDPGSKAIVGPSSYLQKKVNWGSPKGLFLPLPLPCNLSLLVTSEDDVPLARASVSQSLKRHCVNFSDAEGEPSGKVQNNAPIKLIMRIPAHQLAVAQPRPLSVYAFAPVILMGRVHRRYFFFEFS